MFIGKQWIFNCENNHPFWVALAEKPLPAKLLDVGPSNETQHPRLRNTKGAIGRYVTLSYQWGQFQPVSLTSKTYPSFLQCVPFSFLSKMFQDAVIVVRPLDLQYLWIDSLCIFQDSIKYWAEACVEMPRIYQNVQLNIADPLAVDCDAEFLHKQKISFIDSLNVDWPFDHDQKPWKVRLIYKESDEIIFPLPKKRFVLATRAWILQEKLLASRMIYFGSQKMYWEAQTWVMKIYISQLLMISSCGIKWGNSHSLSPELAIIGSELGTYRCNILRDRHNLSFR